MNKELKPCPFCGAEEIYRTYVKTHWVLCSKCGSVGGSGADEKNAIKKWNTRAYEPELQSLRAENERLSSALKIAIETFQKYEMDVEEYPTIEHINMMNALYSALKDSNNE